jgi:hypothetical protein
MLEWHRTWLIARLALVLYYLVSGFSKIANFRGAVVEMAEAGMPAPAAMTLLSIFVELTGSMLILGLAQNAGFQGAIADGRLRQVARQPLPSPFMNQAALLHARNANQT